MAVTTVACRGLAAPRLVCAVLAACLLALTPAALAAPDPIALAYTGSSFLWQQILLNVPPATVESAFRTDVNDCLAAAGSASTATAAAASVNATALFVTYTVTLGTGDTAEAVHQTMFDCTMTTVNDQILSTAKTALPGLADLFPARVVAQVPLLPPPSDVTPAPPVVVGEAETRQAVLFSGSPDVWRRAVAADASGIDAAVVAAVTSVVARATTELTVSVTSLSVEDVDSSRTSFGNGEGGLVARVRIVEKLFPQAVHAYTSDDVNSLLLGMATGGLDPIYAGAGGAGTVKVVAVKVDGAGVGFKCHSACKGMIAMAAVAVAIMIVTMVVMLVFLCHPQCGYAKVKETEREPTTHEGEEEGGTPVYAASTVGIDEPHAALHEPLFQSEEVVPGGTAYTVPARGAWYSTG